MLKDALEDLARFYADMKANGKIVLRYDFIKNKREAEETEENKKEGSEEKVDPVSFESKFRKCRTADLRPGDFVFLKEDEQIPADIVVLWSCKKDGSCFVQTANLDGETNLKKRQAVKFENEKGEKLSPSEICEKSFEITVEENSTKLEEFEGSINKKYSLSISNVLLKGCVLQNTRKLVGLVVFSGKNTKMVKNLKKSKTKWGKMDKGLNLIVLILFVIQQLTIFAFIIGSYVYDKQISNRTWYLSLIEIFPANLIPGVNKSGWYYPILEILSLWTTFFILFEIMIPMSLFVTMEIVKAFQAKYMEWNIKDEIIDKEGKKHVQRMTAKTSNLNWDLGFIDIIFSDKTGTLTQNKMEYTYSFSFGKYYNSDESVVISDVLNPDVSEKNKKHLRHYLYDVVLNNSVAPNVDADVRGCEVTKEISYDGESTDEITLVKKLAVRNQFKMINRTSDSIECEIEGKMEKFKILDEVAFTSDRKRMSVIVENPEGKIYVYSKGADSQMFARLDSSKLTKEELMQYKSATLKFSTAGYRTLVFCYKKITREEYDKFKVAYQKAENSVGKKADEMAAVLKEYKIEDGLKLLGVSAIEDELQEGVPEALDFLLKAGIAVWVLTGDKTETAINICYSANVIEKDVDWEIVLTGNIYTLKETEKENLQLLHKMLRKIDNHFKKKEIKEKLLGDRIKFALVLDNKSLGDILNYYSKIFVEIIKNCKSVICCRVTPLQKAKVTELVQKRLKKRGLSIGDGANDVSMIQKAYVGVGLFGLEGGQAARASDYALPKFKYLVDLLAVEGRYSYIRSCDTILLSFYKNVILAFTNILFVFFNGLTGKLIIDVWLFKMYNTLFHALPPAVFGFWEKDLSSDILKKSPGLYKSLKKNPFFNFRRVFLIISLGALHATICFFVSYFTVGVGNLYGATSNGIFSFGHAISFSFMLVAFGMYAVELKNWNVIGLVIIVGSYIVYIGWTLITSLFPDFLAVKDNYMIPYYAIREIKFFFIVIFNAVVCLIPYLIFKL